MQAGWRAATAWHRDMVRGGSRQGRRAGTHGQGLCSLWVCLVRSHRPELKYEDVPPASSDRLDAVVLVADKDQGVAEPEGVSGK